MKKGLIIQSVLRTDLQYGDYLKSPEFKQLVDSKGNWEEVSAKDFAEELATFNKLHSDIYSFFESENYFVMGCWVRGTGKWSKGEEYSTFLFDVVLLNENQSAVQNKDKNKDTVIRSVPDYH